VCSSSQRPFKCPVCEGRGIVPGGFYNSLGNTWFADTISETCRSCNGKGIIWGYIGVDPAFADGKISYFVSGHYDNNGIFIIDYQGDTSGK
jgi:hypothetical protein